MEVKSIAFKMQLKKGKKQEYKKRHDEIWPELKKLLIDHGIKQYFIFLDEETDTLFAFQQTVGESNSQELGSTEIVQRWWAHMADIMETHTDNSPVSKPLEEVFRL